MTDTLQDLRINPDRMQAAFDELARIGATAEGGVHRPTFSEAHLEARTWFREQIQAAGLEFRTDGAGNHSACLPAAGRGDGGDLPPSYRDHGNRGKLQTLLLGSHLDSVPNGGRFDGALGVMAAFEVLRTVRDAGIQPRVSLEAIDFTDEEGTLVGLLGSAALTGRLERATLLRPRGGREALIQGMLRAGLSEESLLSAARPERSLAGYLELHIEQGKRLERAGVQIGVVSAIVGIWSYRLSFLGRADHAGTTLMDDRRDALLGASAFTLAARDFVMKEFPDCVVNAGNITVAPGAFNIVPARVDVSLEFRSADESEFEHLNVALLECARQQAGQFGLELEIESAGRHSPSLMSGQVQQAFAGACDGLGLSHIPLPSGAGHDGQSFDGVCPAGMIFVPSRDGASHSAREFTAWNDCVNGANVLLQAVLRLAM